MLAIVIVSTVYVPLSIIINSVDLSPSGFAPSLEVDQFTHKRDNIPRTQCLRDFS